jgi:hypothetical protein
MATIVGHISHFILLGDRTKILRNYNSRCFHFLEIANSALHETPEDDVLQELSKSVGNCAFLLGIELGLRLATIEATLLKYPTNEFQQTFDVMIKWKLSSELNTIFMLMNAFKWVDERGLAFLRNKYR